MSLIYLLLLAILQGITEFLPISSSAHLILLPTLTGAEDQGIVLDVAVHVGTLLAVIYYFRKDVRQMVRGMGDIAKGQMQTDAARLFWLLALATVPVVIFGLILKITGYMDALRSIKVIAWTMLVFGLILYVSDRRPAPANDRKWGVRSAVIMGLWQAVALIPGTSRSGATITGARFLGYNREQAARLSMLMSIPTIIASGMLVAGDVVSNANWQLARDAAIAALFACLAALLALTLMMRLLRTVSFTPYVIYRVILGIILLVVAYS